MKYRFKSERDGEAIEQFGNFRRKENLSRFVHNLAKGKGTPDLIVEFQDNGEWIPVAMTQTIAGKRKVLVS